MTSSAVRVRFCPSPTGTPHVGLIRTALFNWAYARHTGGTFVFRIEDTDAARDSQESYLQLLDALRWLGLDWDEGVEVGGPHEPYRQSQRMDLYADVVRRLVEGGHAYESFSTPEEIEARHKAAGRDPKLGYDGVDRDLTDEQKAAFRAEGREPVLRLRMPDDDLTFTDLVRGEVTFKAGSVPDFVIVRANGQPALHAGQPGGRRPHGHHARAARRGPALVDPPADRAVPRAARRSASATGEPRVRAPAVGAGRRQQEAVQARPRVQPVPAPRQRVHARGPAQLPRAARLVDRPGPRHLLDGGDDGRVRRRGRQPEPGALRREEGRGHQLGARPAAGARRLPRPAGPVPAPRGTGPHRLLRGPVAGAPRAARRGRAADPGAHHAAGRGGRHARLPVRRGRRPRDRRRRPRRAARGVRVRARRRGGRAGGPSTTSPPPRRRRRCRPRSSTASASSRGSRSRRCGWR